MYHTGREFIRMLSRPLSALMFSNKTVQATPMNAAVLPLRSWADLCHRYGVPDLFR